MLFHVDLFNIVLLYCIFVVDLFSFYCVMLFCGVLFYFCCIVSFSSLCFMLLCFFVCVLFCFSLVCFISFHVCFLLMVELHIYIYFFF